MKDKPALSFSETKIKAQNSKTKSKNDLTLPFAKFYTRQLHVADKRDNFKFGNGKKEDGQKSFENRVKALRLQVLTLAVRGHLDPLRSAEQNAENNNKKWKIEKKMDNTVKPTVKTENDLVGIASYVRSINGKEKPRSTSKKRQRYSFYNSLHPVPIQPKWLFEWKDERLTLTTSDDKNVTGVGGPKLTNIPEKLNAKVSDSHNDDYNGNNINNNKWQFLEGEIDTKACKYSNEAPELWSRKRKAREDRLKRSNFYLNWNVDNAGFAARKSKCYYFHSTNLFATDILIKGLEKEACIVARGGFDPFFGSYHWQWVHHSIFKVEFERSKLKKKDIRRIHQRSLENALRQLQGTAVPNTTASICKTVLLDEFENSHNNQMLQQGEVSVSSCSTEIPRVLVGYDGDWLSVSGTLLKDWEYAHLQPYSKPCPSVNKYMIMCICTNDEACDHEDICGSCSSFFKDFSAFYELCGLGKMESHKVDIVENMNDSGENLNHSSVSMSQKDKDPICVCWKDVDYSSKLRIPNETCVMVPDIQHEMNGMKTEGGYTEPTEPDPFSWDKWNLVIGAIQSDAMISVLMHRIANLQKREDVKGSSNMSANISDSDSESDFFKSSSESEDGEVNEKDSKTTLIFVVRPLETSKTSILLIDSLLKLEERLLRLGAFVKFQIVPMEMVLSWRRSRTDMQDIATSVFCRKQGGPTKDYASDPTSLVIADSVRNSYYDEEATEDVYRDTHISSTFHLCCAWSWDKTWIATSWTDECGSWLKTKGYKNVEEYETISNICKDTLSMLAEMKTEHPIKTIVIGFLGGIRRNLSRFVYDFFSSLADTDSTGIDLKACSIIVCGLYTDTVSVPKHVFDKGKKCRVVANCRNQEALIRRITVSSYPLKPAMEDLDANGNIINDDVPLGVVEMDVMEVLHQTLPEKESSNSLFADLIMEQYGRLAWLSRGAFIQKPLSALPLHFTAAAHLAYWLNGIINKPENIKI